MTNSIDNKLISLAKRYADALLQVAAGRGELDAVLSDLKLASSAYDSSDDLKKFMDHPAVSVNDKKAAVKEIFENKILVDSLNFLYVLVEKNKFSLIDTILYCYEEGMDVVRNILKVDVISAVEIDEDLKDALKVKLESKFQKSVKFEYKVNPEIIAGVILKIKDKTIDGSMAHKLECLEKQLA